MCYSFWFLLQLEPKTANKKNVPESCKCRLDALHKHNGRWRRDHHGQDRIFKDRHTDNGSRAGRLVRQKTKFVSDRIDMGGRAFVLVCRKVLDCLPTIVTA
jgi:hypothetical protein